MGEATFDNKNDDYADVAAKRGLAMHALATAVTHLRSPMLTSCDRWRARLDRQWRWWATRTGSSTLRAALDAGSGDLHDQYDNSQY
eukprot:6630855-Pyramimonas_sp.AAC.1